MTLFILGAPRSGTTLLYKALCLHPDAAWLSNWNRRAPSFPSVSAVNRVARARPRLRDVAWFDGGANAYVEGSRRGLVARAVPTPVEGEPVCARCGFDERAADGGAGDEQALRSMVAGVNRYAGGSVFIGKRIANNRRVPQLSRALPDSRFVMLVRDGRAVALSLSEVDWWDQSWIWWAGMTPSEWTARGHDPWTLCGLTWVEETTAALNGVADLPSDRVMTIRYEDLLRNPLAVLQQVAAFGLLSPSTSWNDAVRRLSFPDRNTRWRAGLPADVIPRLTRLQQQYLTRFGYLPDETAISNRAGATVPAQRSAR